MRTDATRRTEPGPIASARGRLVPLPHKLPRAGRAAPPLEFANTADYMYSCMRYDGVGQSDTAIGAQMSRAVHQSELAELLR